MSNGQDSANFQTATHIGSPFPPYTKTIGDSPMVDRGISSVWQYPSYQVVNAPKPFKLGFMLGRFQHIHIGHEMMIDKAMASCDKLILLVGSEQAKGTLRNPFDIELRKELIGKVFINNPNLIIDSIKDMTHEDDHCVEWGRFVLEEVSRTAHNKGIKINPDLMIFGDDEERKSWFDPEDILGISQLVISRGTIDISATKMRKSLVENNFWKWRQFANENIHNMFDKLRDELITIPEYKEMQNK